MNIYMRTNAETSQFATSYQMMERWAANGWKTTKGEDVKNKEEWIKLHEFAKVHRCTLFLQCHHDYRKWLEEELRR